MLPYSSSSLNFEIILVGVSFISTSLQFPQSDDESEELRSMIFLHGV